MSTGFVEPPASIGVAHWERFMADMQAFAGDPVPLEAHGLLVRVTGLVLEAAGIRVPVGSVCEVRMPGQPTVLAEVVGFSGDCAFLMPTGSLQTRPWRIVGDLHYARLYFGRPGIDPCCFEEWTYVRDQGEWRRIDVRGYSH